MNFPLHGWRCGVRGADSIVHLARNLTSGLLILLLSVMRRLSWRGLVRRRAGCSQAEFNFADEFVVDNEIDSHYDSRTQLFNQRGTE
jgi:hypothetical protein